MEYPYLIVRYMPAVYRKVAIEFVTDAKTRSRQDILSFVASKPFLKDKLTAKCRAELIDAVKHLSKKSKHRMCLVFGQKDAVYVDSDGKTNESTEPPSGGIDLKGLTGPGL